MLAVPGAVDWIMEIIRAENQELLNQVEKLYLTAFPKSERKPFDLMVEKQREGRMDLLCLMEGGRFAGLAFTAKDGDLVLLDYFAIDDARRGTGCGTAALKAICGCYEGRRLVLEIERTDCEAENHEERVRRKHFYLKNGMSELGYQVLLFGVEMEMLSNQADVGFQEYLDLYIHVFGERIRDHVKRIG